MEYDNALTAFAVLANDFEETGNIGSGISKLFAPILAGRAGKKFERSKFIQEVGEKLDLEMHPYAVDYFAEILEREGYLRPASTDSGQTDYIIEDVALESNKLPLSQIENLVSEYCDFAEARLDSVRLEIGIEALQQGFFERIVRFEFVGLIASKAEPENDSAISISDTDRYIDFIFSSFVLKLQASDAAKFELLTKICNAALLSEVVLNLQKPTSKVENLQNLQIFMDTPLVLDALGMNEQVESEEYALELISQLRTQKAHISVFNHTLEEIVSVLKSTLESHKRGVSYGPLAKLMFRDSTAMTAAQSIINNPIGSLKHIGIGIFQGDMMETAKRLAVFTHEQESNLSAMFAAEDWAYQSSNTKHEKDAKSIASILRLRGSTLVTEFASSKYIFVTRNNAVVRLSKKYLDENSSSINYFPPAVTDRHIAGLLWITFGGGGSNLSRMQLLANCSATTASNSNVKDRVYMFLSKMDPKRAEQFKALMQNHRAENFVSSAVFGDVKLVTEENADELYEEALRGAAAELTAKHHQEIRNIEEKLGSKISTLQTEQEERLLVKEEQVVALMAHTEELKESLLDSQSSILTLQEIEKSNKQMRLNLVKSAMRRAATLLRVAEFFSVALISLLVMIVSGWVQLVPDWLQLALTVLSAFIAALTIYLAPNRFLGRLLIKNIRDRVFKSALANVGIDSQEFLVDWDTPEAVKSNSEGIQRDSEP